MKEVILKQYDEISVIYNSFGQKLKDIILELLNDNKISVHNINCRLKDRKSLRKKIDAKKDKYTSINDITDICGIRIITFLESDVDKVATILESELSIDKENSIDKRLLKTDQFGYRSLHYVVELNDHRLKLSENKKYKGLKVEIQVRSILQHAWAEIEHDLGYKGEITIPEDLKRSFNRLAALLETADIEFDRLKRDINAYEQNIGKVIEEHPDEVKIVQASVLSFISNNAVFYQAQNIIRENIGCTFADSRDIRCELERFPLFSISTIGQLEKIVNDNREHYLRFVDVFTKEVGHYKELDFSLPLFYFQHFLAASKESEEFMETYYNYSSQKIGGSSAGSDRFIEIFRATKK